MNPLVLRKHETPALRSLFVGVCLVLAASLPAFAQQWSVTSAPVDPASNIWSSIASSADGLKLVAAGDFGTYVSTNRGATWVNTFSKPYYYGEGWPALASSADGVKIVGTDGLQIYGSTDSGNSWNVEAAPSGPVYTWVTCSPDGTKILALAGTDYSVYQSIDSGETWFTNRGYDTQLVSRSDESAAISADGATMVIASIFYNNHSTDDFGGLEYSLDSGATWELSDAPSNTWNWSAVTCSSNGDIVVAVGENLTNFFEAGPIYISTNSGVNWKPTTAPMLSWKCVTCSADGSKITAGAVGADFDVGSGVYSSTNYGATWFSNETITSDTNILGCLSIASSADGKLLAACGDDVAILVNPSLSGAKPPNLTIALLRPNSVVVSWPANGSYLLQQNSRLVTTNWTVTRYPITTAYGTNSISITLPLGNLFFRLSGP